MSAPAHETFARRLIACLDIRAGRVCSMREVMRDLEDDIAAWERCPDSEFVPLPE